MTSAIPNYDATFCGKQPIQHTGTIQAHGVLLVVDKSNFNILQASENIDTLLALPVEKVVDKPLRNLMSHDSFTEMENYSSKGKFKNKQVNKITFRKGGNEVKYIASIHEKDEALLIEVEFADVVNEFDTGGDLFQQVNDTMVAIEAATTVDEICNVAAIEIKKWSGFDKVMIYWFDEEWNGTVLAQAMEAGMDDYLGLKFPASDIPKPARDLYLKNPVRLIPDSSYVPVKLFPLTNPKTGLITDLANCKLRSVVSVHLQYLKNMGVATSMSTRIIHNNKLGGLIACHHRTPKFLTFRQVSAFEMISAVVSGKVSMTLNLEAEKIKVERNCECDALLEKVYLRNSLTKGLMESKDLLLQLLHADGVVIAGNGKLEKAGLVPGDKQLLELVQWLQEQNFGDLLHLPSLTAAFEPAANYAKVASGILAITIQANRGNFIIAFRPEEITTVLWGGNPHDALTFEPGSATYHPRNSFNIWKQTTKNTSLPWTTEVLDVAKIFRSGLVTFKLQQRNNDMSTVLKEFKMVTDIIPQLIASATPNGQIDYCNEQWKTYTGFELDKVMSLGWTTFLHPAEAQKIKRDFETCLQTQTVFNAECRLRKSDGSYRWFSVKALPLTDDKGRILKWYASCTDIDEHKMMNEVLEQQVENRTRELRAINIELNETNKELEQFVSVASHDLQEQVRKILIFGDLLKDYFLQDEEHVVSPYVDKIIESSFKLKSLLIDLLTYAGLTTRTSFIAVDLNDVVESVINELSPVVEKSKATIKWQGLPVIDAMEGEMNLVFKNLISNSIKFHNKIEPPEIRIKAELIAVLNVESPADGSGKFVRITVTDNGAGFDNQFAELIFQVFQRLPGEHKKEGTGIGLAIVKKITDKYHAIIKASGKQNEGAVFILVLPLRQNTGDSNFELKKSLPID